MRNINIYFAGVGGEGLMLLKEWIANFIINLDKAMRIEGCEKHGLAQRGGSTDACSRVLPGNDKKVWSPTLPWYSADYYIGLELQETVRNLKYSNPNKTIIITDLNILPPMLVLGGDEKLPTKLCLEKRLRDFYKERFIGLEATKLAKESFGHHRYSNAILYGVFIYKLIQTE